MISNKYIHCLTESFIDLHNYGLENLNTEKVNDLVVMAKEHHVIPFRVMPTNMPVFNLPLPIAWVQIFCIKAGKVGKIHKDGIDRQCALNIPLLNCNMGHMQWFDNDYDMVTIDETYTKVRLIRDELNTVGTIRPNEIATFSTLVTCPSIVFTNQWHRMDNTVSLDDRYMLSVRFKNNPSFDDVAALFTDTRHK
jgi:hypothetical protein